VGNVLLLPTVIAAGGLCKEVAGPLLPKPERFAKLLSVFAKDKNSG